MRRVVILHEWDGPAYFQALDRLVREETGAPPLYREMWFIRQMAIGLLRRRGALIARSLRNAAFFLRSFFLRDAIVVMGFAPFDPSMLFWTRLRKSNRIVYHTSWLKWDGSDVPHNRPFLRNLRRRKWREFIEDPKVQIVSVLGASKDEMLRFYRKDASAFTAIPHTVDTAVFHPAEPRPGGPLRVAYLGRLNSIKGIDVLSEIIAKAEPGRFAFGVIGEGPEWRLLEPLKDRFEYHGHVAGKAEVARLLRNHDVLVMPSVREAFGIALIEAMSCGLVCVVTNGLFAKDLVVDGRNGIVAERTAEGFLAALRRLDEDRELLARFRRAGLERVREFAMPAVMEKWRGVLSRAG